MGLSIFYGLRGTDEERLKFLDYVFECGETNWDSSDVYGDSEDLLGKYVLNNLRLLEFLPPAYRPHFSPHILLLSTPSTSSTNHSPDGSNAQATALKSSSPPNSPTSATPTAPPL
jgi:hypothetical protein